MGQGLSGHSLSFLRSHPPNTPSKLFILILDGSPFFLDIFACITYLSYVYIFSVCHSEYYYLSCDNIRISPVLIIIV